MTAYFRVTVEDLDTGDRQIMEVAEGDYLLIPFGSCYLAGVVKHGDDAVQLTVRGHRPAGKARIIESKEAS